MIKKNKTLLVLVGLIVPLFLFSQNDKLFLQKRIIKEDYQKKIHPQQVYFNKQKQEYRADTKSNNFNKLLVLLVDFQEDDNPNTTGNGKFLLSKDDIDINFPTMHSLGYDIIGSPPHDHEFFTEQLNAVKYYYQAVSFGTYNLEFDIYPKNKQAYTLPHEMAYYNPVESELFVQRIEQYFKDIFETADQDEDRPVAFADYGHYMIIHAGSDYQHDVMGDSFHDIPSFFISIGTGKEVFVDNGQTAIKHASNVPEMITQDIRTFDNGSEIIHYGHGSVNSVFVHEFGHSLGFVDLYNTLNNRPAVGMFDIMDSGGSGILTDMCENGEYYAIEGALPALPSVWTRLITFEQTYLDMGILKDITKCQLNSELNIKASSAKHNPFNIIPYFYRLRLSEDEYILIENRNLDPDGDGGTSLQSALNGRVVLHPSPIYGDGITYEYDWLLPGWMDNNYKSVGGGLLIWHIDDKQIFQDGIQYDEGFFSNFELNRVNTNINGNKAVRVIEADNLHDIGNPYSYFWTGTAFEYFFKHKPILDENGTFIQWSEEIHQNELSSFTKPALLSNQGKPSSWKISNISKAKPVMSFEISNSSFDHTNLIGMFPNLHSVSNVAKLQKHKYKQISIIDEINGMSFYTYYYDDTNPTSWEFYWEEEDINQKPDFDIIVTNFKPDDIEEYLLVYDTKIMLLDSGMRVQWDFENSITDTPFNFKKDDKSYLVVNFADSTSIYEVFYESYSLSLNHLYSLNESSKTFSDNDNLYLLANNKLVKFDILSKNTSTLELNDNFSIFEPVIYVNNSLKNIFLMSDNYRIYKINGPDYKQIFNLKDYSNQEPSNLALAYSENFTENLIIFNTNNQIFALNTDGYFVKHFPVTLKDSDLSSFSFPYIFKLQGELIIMLQDQLQGLFALDLSGRHRIEYSQYWNKGNVKEQFFIDTENNRLVMLYADADNNVFSAEKTLNQDDSIIWNGYRNSNYGLLKNDINVETVADNNIEIFVYPNPVNQKTANLRINNSKSKAVVKIYNISGQLIYSEILQETKDYFRDVRINTDKLSSGIYFAIVSIDNKNYQNKFAIIK